MSDNNGFTLIEVVIVTLIGAIVFGAAFSLLLYNTNLYTRANNEVNIQYECTQILERLTIFAKESAEIEKQAGATPEVTTYIFKNEDNSTPPVLAGFASVTFDSEKEELSISGVDEPYKQISEFEIKEPADQKLREIEITGRRHKAEHNFKTTVKLRNYEEP